jgi:formamidopyrimidine-DNA glycosylase
MPELPEVETVARKLDPEIVGQTIEEVQVLWPRTIDRPALHEFQSRLVHTMFRATGRRGKFLLLHLNTGWQLMAHLRMSGRFVTLGPDEDVETDAFKHLRVLLTFGNGAQLAFIDPRKFGRLYLVREIEDVVGRLGPEPLDEGFTVTWLRRELSGRRGEIKRLLLDQRFVAGLGNIYASEILWRAGVHPQRIAGSLDAGECERLHEAVVNVLRQAIEEGGTSLDDRQYTYPNGKIGGFQEHLQVYDRDGESCPRCGYRLNRIVQGQRSTYYCPVCQPSQTHTESVIS